MCPIEVSVDGRVLHKSGPSFWMVQVDGVNVYYGGDADPQVTIRGEKGLLVQEYVGAGQDVVATVGMRYVKHPDGNVDESQIPVRMRVKYVANDK